MRSILVFLAAGLVACRPQPEVVPTATAALIEPAAPRAQQAEPPAPVRLVPFVEAVELDVEQLERRRVSSFLPEYALVDARGRGRDYALLKLDTLEVLPLPALDETNHPGAMRIRSAAESVVVADVLSADSVAFFVLRPARMAWEEAGRFDLPPPVASDNKSRTSPANVNVYDGRVILELTDTVSPVQRFALDLESLVWAPHEPPAADGPCVMARCRGDRDLVRWGMDATGKQVTCVAVREAESEPWTHIDDPKPELLVVRQCRMIDDSRVLVTGGVRFAFPPFSRRVDVVDLAGKVVRPLGDPELGMPLKVPGEHVWIRPGTVSRFDPATEQFVTEPAPKLEFEPSWFVTLDDLTVLYGRADGKEPAQFAKLGLRPE